MNHTITIQWSTDDHCFVVFLPEFADTVLQPITHSDTYETTLKNAREVIDLLIETAQTDGQILPQII
jgi:predicted RNase H-like HicB family nuclease